jgi:hypothetical protein
MRKFGIKYARMHPDPVTVRDAFVAVSTEQDWQAVLDRWYSIDTPGRRVTGAEMFETCSAA